MKYISFDIECCDGKHICEFGYVITDENFKILEKECFTINPKKRFKLVGREHRADCILTFSEETYYKSPEFPAFYSKIKKLLSTTDSIIFGYAINNDAYFLSDACKRYELSPLNFGFVDSQLLYREFSGEKGSISLEKAASMLELDQSQIHHKSDEDALQAIKIVEKICEKSNCSMQELIARYNSASGTSHNFNIRYNGNDLQTMINTLETNPDALNNKRKQQCIQQFAKEVQSQGKVIGSCLNGKKLCFSKDNEQKHTLEVIKIIQHLANYGCKYNMKVSENDYYVADESELKREPERNTRYIMALETDGGVKIIAFTEFLNMVNLTVDKLKAIKTPTIKKKSVKKKAHLMGKVSSTLGDMLKAKGEDVTKLLSKD